MSDIFDSALVAILSTDIGKQALYRRFGHADLPVTVGLADRTPEDAIPGNYTVRVVRNMDIPNGPMVGDKLVIDAIEYGIFQVRSRDGDPDSRLFLTRNKS